MASIKKGDFVEVEYTGMIKEGNEVFDTTSEEVAKKEEIAQEGMSYGPVTICIGEGHLVKGLDDELEGKETGQEYTIELAPENAFGKKNAKMLKLVNTNIFLKQNIKPTPGLQVNIDGVLGTIRSVAGGRTIVDFNHPLSGKEIIYKIKPNKVLTDDIEKIKSFLELQLNTKDIEVKKEDTKTKIEYKQDIPKEVLEQLGKKLKDLVPSVGELVWTKL